MDRLETGFIFPSHVQLLDRNPCLFIESSFP